ncbi:hypothetical protein [Paraclostridium sordellii]|uniref:Uncharacterized protein n=1 Tax=Paraclostridium sordellii TaxID=1505 RepID=A0A0C7LEY4_PARSO|nr:hypothetical protein [Paeniclostridium sordellii]AUN14252.1 hypothetical protein RSJ16_08460 [Paeniclostridium sordellii]MDU7967921.1 hypothetical protein [Paeniclostridium sordellii]CEN78299.1 Uncharacterised protein [[Clostridium] sordellii] [Paeniclostridium sordellii]CEP40524.1 Uncharacterised protein [[Clostridium] sordellii] [Paeniclostridium sordellii]CEQ03389.1 Uncharacterised protein [[Clostridium] sordellii] [Paeniclostridium sordellii]
MKSGNNKALENRKKAMESSKKIIQDYKVFTAPLEVRKKRSILGSSCGILVILASIVFYVVKLYNVATGLVIGGILTLGFNLITLKSLNKK